MGQDSDWIKLLEWLPMVPQTAAFLQGMGIFHNQFQPQGNLWMLQTMPATVYGAALASNQMVEVEWRRWCIGAICKKHIPFPSLPVKHECSYHVETCTNIKKQWRGQRNQAPVQHYVMVSSIQPCSTTWGMYLQQMFCSRHGECLCGKTWRVSLW